MAQRLKIPPVPRALGYITEISNQIVTVKFSDIPTNPDSVRGQTRTFKLDIGRQRFASGTWVVVSWGNSLRQDAAGNLLVQGSVGSGVNIRTIEKASHEPELFGWLPQVRRHLQDVENHKLKIEQGKPSPLPSANVLNVLQSTASGAITGKSVPWLGVPVPLPVMKEEWNFSQSYLRIGYVSFNLETPVEDIQISEVMPNDSVQTLRSRTPIQKNNMFATQQVTISFTLHGQDAQNQILLPLIKMARKAPFLPVFNTLLFEHDITAITITSLQTTTLPGFPNSIKAVIQALSFNWQLFLPTATEFSGFDWQICYPLLKMWVEKPCPGTLNFHVPMGYRWDGKFQLLHPAESWLKTANEFGELAEKAGRTNSDIDVAVQAVNWRDAELGTDASNFRPAQNIGDGAGDQLTMGANVARVQNFLYQERTSAAVLGALVGESFQRIQPVTFLRVRTELAAFQLIDHGDCIKVYRGLVTLKPISDVSRLILADNQSAPPGTVYSTDNSDIDKDDLKALIGNNDQATINLIRDGGFTFVVNQDSPVFDNMSTWHRTPITKDPREIPPVPDTEDVFEPPSLVIEQIGCEFQNTIAQLQPRGHRTATHQYLGSNATVYTVHGTIKSQLDVGVIEQFFQTVNRLGREYRGKINGTPFGGFVFVENEFFQFMGTGAALVLSWSTQTISDFPGALKFEMQLVEFDQTQRRKEVLSDLFKDFSDLPMGLSEGAEQGLSSDFRIFSQHDNFQVRYVRQRDFHNRLRKVELYPDLCLPTHSELAKWVVDIQNGNVWDFENQVAIFDEYDFLNFENGGTGWHWGSVSPITDGNGNVIADELPTSFLQLSPPPEKPERFADPDFYVGPTQQSGELFVENVITLSKNRQITVSDPYGAVAKIRAGQRITEQSMHADPQGSVKKALDKSSKKELPPALGGSAGGLDIFLNNQDAQNNSGSFNTQSDDNAFSIPEAQGIEKPPTVRSVDDRPLKDRIAVYGDIAAVAAKRYNIPADLLFAHIEAESQWRANATSRSGARGLGQLEPSTAAGLGVTIPGDLYDPVTNIFTTAKYISQLRKIFGNHPDGERLAIAAYNAGPNAVKKAGYQVPDFNETQTYVLRVIQNRTHYKTAGGVTAFGSKAGLKDATRRESVQLFSQFKQGFGYNLRDIFPHMIVNGGHPINSTQVFQPSWFRKVINTGGDVFYVVKAANLPDFIEAERRYKVFPTLVKIPEVLAGKNLYDHTANSIAADEKTVANASDLLNPFSAIEHAPEILAGGAQALGTLAGGGSQLDALHAEAEKIRQGVSVGEVVRGGVEMVAAGGTFLGTLAGGGTISDAIKASESFIAEKEAAADKEAGPTYHPPTIGQIFHDPVNGRDVFHDLRQEIVIGRLVSAFPTFYIAIVDGGRSLRVWRLFDHVYGMMAVTKIAVHRTRKSPIETAVVGFSNMFGHMTNQANDMDRVKRDDTRGIWTMEALYRGITNTFKGDFNEETVAMWARHLNSLMLKPGARLHIRMGYGSDASLLPVVHNGVISEVPIDEGEIEVVSLSDGVELTNDIAPNALQGAMPVTRLNSLFGEGLNPRELVMSFLAPNSLFDSVSNFLGQHTAGDLGGFLYFNFRNAYGIEHFGAPFRQGLRFDDGENGINVYDPEHSTPFTHTSAWDSTFRVLQPWKWSSTRKLIGINMSNATPWDIFETVRRTVPDYILYTHPFELRSTLFMGKGWFPIFTGYLDEVDEGVLQSGGTINREDYFDWKPFQQVHVITSDWNLLGNKVRADATDVVTKVQAVGTYNGWLPGSSDLSLESSFVMMLDEDIYDEFQKMKIVESGLYSTVNMKVTEANADEGGQARVAIGAILLLGGIIFAPLTGGLSLAAVLTGAGLGASLVAAGSFSLLEGPVRSFLMSRRIMDYFAAMVLKDHVKDMYQGPFVVLGSPYFKPYDYIAVADRISGMNGLAEVKECVQTMSLETGYVTTVTPDCLASFVDFEGHDLMAWLQIATGHLLLAISSAAVVGQLARQVSPYFALRGLRRYREWLVNSIRDSKGGQVFGKTIQQARDALGKTDQAISKVGQFAKIGDKLKIKDVLEEFTGFPEIKLFDENAPIFIKLEIQAQRLLRAIPGTKLGGTINSLAGKLATGARTTVFQAGVKANNKAVEAAERLTKAEATLDTLGRSSSEIKEVRKILKTGGDAAKALDAGVVAAIKEVDSATASLARAQSFGSALAKIPGAVEGVQRVVKGALSRSALLTVGSQAINIAIGGLADYIVRWAIARQCLILFPLRIHRKELTAGINGHRGAVAGDDPGAIDHFVQNIVDTYKVSWVGNLLPIISDMVAADIEYTHPDTTPPFFRG
jgi:hypothetical protein